MPVVRLINWIIDYKKNKFRELFDQIRLSWENYYVVRNYYVIDKVKSLN